MPSKGSDSSKSLRNCSLFSFTAPDNPPQYTKPICSGVYVLVKLNVPLTSMKTFEIFFALISLTVISIASAAPAAVDSAHWTVDDTLTNEWASAWEISPDCHHAVWVKNIPDVGQDQLFAGGNLNAGGNLYLSSLTEQTNEIQLTDGSECRNPRWSPDGKRIAFISSRADAKTGNKANAQVWLIDPSDKEVRQLTEGDQDVWAFEWSDAEHILFLKPDAPAPPAGQAKKKQAIRLGWRKTRHRKYP